MLNFELLQERNKKKKKRNNCEQFDFFLSLFVCCAQAGNYMVGGWGYAQRISCSTFI